MFPKPLISKHSASLTGTVALISKLRFREARPHKWSLTKSQLLSGLGAGTMIGIPEWGCLFVSGVKRRKVVRLSSTLLGQHFECPL